MKETIDIYNDTYKYLENFSADERTMVKYIIGTISDLDSAVTPQQKGENAIANYFRKITNEQVAKEREEVIKTTEEDIRLLADVIKKAMDDNNLCVIGNEDKIENSKDLFNSTRSLLSNN